MFDVNVIDPYQVIVLHDDMYFLSREFYRIMVIISLLDFKSVYQTIQYDKS